MTAGDDHHPNSWTLKTTEFLPDVGHKLLLPWGGSEAPVAATTTSLPVPAPGGGSHEGGSCPPQPRASSHSSTAQQSPAYGLVSLHAHRHQHLPHTQGKERGGWATHLEAQPLSGRERGGDLWRCPWGTVPVDGTCTVQEGCWEGRGCRSSAVSQVSGGGAGAAGVVSRGGQQQAKPKVQALWATEGRQEEPRAMTPDSQKEGSRGRRR